MADPVFEKSARDELEAAIGRVLVAGATPAQIHSVISMVCEFALLKGEWPDNVRSVLVAIKDATAEIAEGA